MRRYIFKILFQSFNKLAFITSLQGSPNPPPQPLYRWTRKWRLGRQKTSVGSITGSGGEANCGPRHPGCDESPPACARQEYTARGERARMHPLWAFVPSTWGSSSPMPTKIFHAHFALFLWVPNHLMGVDVPTIYKRGKQSIYKCKS